jgi:hypothetical protein
VLAGKAGLSASSSLTMYRIRKAVRASTSDFSSSPASIDSSGLGERLPPVRRALRSGGMLKRESFSIDNIYVPTKRPTTLNSEHVREIADSMLANGQETPILVRALRAGRGPASARSGQGARRDDDHRLPSAWPGARLWPSQVRCGRPARRRARFEAPALRAPIFRRTSAVRRSVAPAFVPQTLWSASIDNCSCTFDQ